MLVGCPKLQAAHVAIQKELDAELLKLYDNRVVSTARSALTRAIQAERAPSLVDMNEKADRNGRRHRRKPDQPLKTVERAKRDLNDSIEMRPVGRRALSARLRCYDISGAHQHTPEAQSGYPGEWRDLHEGHRGWRNAHEMSHALLLRGVLPDEMDRVIRGLGFAECDTIPVSRKLVETVITAAHREIWKPRCSETTSYEAKSWGIKPAAKRAQAPKRTTLKRKRREQEHADEAQRLEEAPEASAEPVDGPETGAGAGEPDEIGPRVESTPDPESANRPRGRKRPQTEADRVHARECDRLVGTAKCMMCREHHGDQEPCHEPARIECLAVAAFKGYMFFGTTLRLPSVT